MAVASPVLQLGLLHMRPIQFWLKQRVPCAAWRHRCHHVTVTRVWVSALARWRDPFWLKWGMILDTEHRRKVVTTDASNKGWGALCEGKPSFSLWSEEESDLHINYIEMLAVCKACQFFLPDIRGHHVLIRSDSRAVVSYINHQGGLILKWLCMLANDLLVWVQNNLRSLKAMHVPGKINQEADMLSRNNFSSEEWCRDLDPVTSDVSVVLSFMQEMLDKQRSSSTIIVYAAAIVAFHALMAGRSVGRDSAVTQFWRGARRMNPQHSRTVPPWDLPTILRALKGSPFEPLQSSSFRVLSLKTCC